METVSRKTVYEDRDPEDNNGVIVQTSLSNISDTQTA